jgi:LmbE family N-acetylglucosaminyl deacetylase
MIDLPFGQIREILCLGAHCDDIEIGCGGAIQKLVAANPGVRVRWVVFSSDSERAAEARASAPLFAGEASLDVRVEGFRGRYFPYVGDGIKEYFDRLVLETPQPDLVFTHYRFDLHQDHRLLSELTYNTFRDHLVLEYEIPKWDGDMGQPNTYVSLDEELCARIGSARRRFGRSCG